MKLIRTQTKEITSYLAISRKTERNCCPKRLKVFILCSKNDVQLISATYGVATTS